MEQAKDSAEFLDIVYGEFTNPAITDAEVGFIVSKLEKRSRILDIGCGTGRHAIPLAKRGFEVVGLDSTKAMLEELARKLDLEGMKIDLLYEDILTYTGLDADFDAAICFWNSFDQIATDQASGRIFFENVYRSLKDGGKLILEISNPKSFDPGTFAYHSTVERDGHRYETTYRLKDYDRVRKTSLGNERIVVKNGNAIVRQVSSDFVLKWWEMEEIVDLSRLGGFKNIEILGDDFAQFDGTGDTLLFVMTK